MDFAILGYLLLIEHREISHQRLDIIFGGVDEVDCMFV